MYTDTAAHGYPERADPLHKASALFPFPYSMKEFIMKQTITFINEAMSMETKEGDLAYSSKSEIKFIRTLLVHPEPGDPVHPLESIFNIKTTDR